MAFETIQNIINWNEEEEERGKQEASEPTDCPDCAWPLNIDEECHRACPVCERTWR